MSLAAAYWIGVAGHFPACIIVLHRDDHAEFGMASVFCALAIALFWPAYTAWVLGAGYWREFVRGEW